MSKITLAPNAAGTGIFTVAAPGTSTDRTLTLPDATTTLVGTDATQTLTNKTLQGGALTQSTAQATTSGLNIDFTGIPSWAKRVTVMLSGVSTTGTSAVLLQVGTSSGFLSSGYLSAAVAGGGAAQNGTQGFILSASNNNTDTLGGAIFLINLTGTTWVVHGGFRQNGGNAPTTTSGEITLAAALDRVRLTSAGSFSFDAGTINIMWEG